MTGEIILKQLKLKLEIFYFTIMLILKSISLKVFLRLFRRIDGTKTYGAVSCRYYKSIYIDILLD